MLLSAVALKFAPLIVTVAPGNAEGGVNDSMVGAIK
jgi:hypothetical protein